jgi:chromosomal replication initiation ATPase DnaA
MKKPYLTENVFVCRTISIILIKKHVDLSHIDISNVFGKKNHSIVSHALTDFKSKNERIKEHKIFLDAYNEIDKKIIDFKQTLK